MQKKLIASLAVACAVAAPVAVADISMSGSSKMMIQYDGDNVYLNDGWSRLRFNASADLGNGQSVFANHEFGVHISDGTWRTGNGQRVTVVGLKGDWGKIALGSQWEIGTKVIWKACPWMNNGCTGGMNNGRVQDSARYDGSVGPFGFAADVVASSDIDTAGFVLTYDVGGVGVAGGYESRDGADNWSGIGASMSLGDVGLGGYYNEVGSANGWNGLISFAGLNVAVGENDGTGATTAGYKVWGSGSASFTIEISDTEGSDTTGVGILRFDY